MTAAARMAVRMSFSGYTWLSITVVGRGGGAAVLHGYWSMSTAFSSGDMRHTGAPSHACAGTTPGRVALPCPFLSHGHAC